MAPAKAEGVQGLRIFYSHAMKLYGTTAEAREISEIERRFPGCVIVNPGKYQKSGTETSREEMEYFLKLVDACDCLVFSMFSNTITIGVEEEVNHALSAKKQVYQLRRGRLIPVLGSVSPPTKVQRILLYLADVLESVRR